MADLARQSRACGALLGLAIGDAIGTTNEFRRMSAPAFPTLATGPVTGIVGGGPFAVTPGQVTDDTQMACCLYSSLSSLGHFDADDVAQRYLEWSHHAFDVGAQTGSALSLIGAGRAPTAAGKAVWIESGSTAAANGSLMRTAPIGAVLSSAGAVRAASLEDSAITHFDPRCRLACATYNAAVYAGLDGLDENQMWESAKRELEPAADQIAGDYEGGELRQALAAIREDLRMAAENDPDLYGDEVNLERQQGFVRVALRLAFWELLHAPTFKAAVLDAANRGGDADTNAAIVGALVGSHSGIQGLPPDWQATVLDCKPAGNPVWSGPYHPKIFNCR